jgi:zinc transport system permease protein
MSMTFVEDGLQQLCVMLGVSSFELYPLIGLILLGITTGAVGSLVVANRMAFFSDAMAHTAFAGVALALLGVILFTGARSTREADPYLYLVPWIMGGIGIIVGCLIAYVKEKSTLTSDTVIGVFFALSIGVGAMLLPEIRTKIQIDADQFLFGSISVITSDQLVTLLVLMCMTLVIVSWKFNALLLSSFNPSLARSRGHAVRGDMYLLMILLALVVNLSVKAVGVLLINALLVVPAAASANLSRNTRQVFWWTLLGCVGCGVLGHQLSQRVRLPIGDGRLLEFGTGGTIVVLSVVWFFLTLLYRNVIGRRVTQSA